MKLITTEKIPTWALCYLINDDPTGLTDEDKELADDYCKRLGTNGAPVFDPKGEPYFSSYPAFGLATEVEDTDIYEP